MRSIFVLTVICLIFVLGCSNSPTSLKEKAYQEAQFGINETYGKLPLVFIENNGQVAEPVRFMIKGPRGNIFFTPQEVVFEIIERQPESENISAIGEKPQQYKNIRGVVVKMKFVDSNPKVQLMGQNELSGRVNVLKGKDPQAWRTDIRRFSRIAYNNLYPSIDLIYSSEEKELTWNLNIDSFKELNLIQINYKGIESLSVDSSGNLVIKTSLGNIIEKAPRLILKKQKTSFDSRFILLNRNTVGIKI